MKRIVILASGDGSLAQAIIDASRAGSLGAEVVAVVSDQPTARVLERARTANIKTLVLTMQKDRPTWNAAMLSAMEKLNPDLVVSAGYMRVLSPEFVARFRTINSHPALLPLFPGAHAVRDALNAHATVTGTTIHWVDAGLDSGEIISQIEVPIRPDDTESTLHERIKIAERSLLVSAIKSWLITLENPNV